ncbi:hypothetical protein [Lutimonas sp.]|uniref:hypothetical protein n=1 Tax=Lutimonas sp. TaxID=1872403 RepID=UPI003D9B7A13
MKKHVTLILGLAIAASSFLTSCGASSGTTANRKNSVHHIHHGNSVYGAPYYHDRDIIIVDPVVPDIDIPEPVVLPEDDW